MAVAATILTLLVLAVAVTSLLGACRLAAGDPTSAEPPLLRGYEGLEARAPGISAIEHMRIHEALQRLVSLFAPSTVRPSRPGGRNNSTASSKVPRVRGSPPRARPDPRPEAFPIFPITPTPTSPRDMTTKNEVTLCARLPPHSAVLKAYADSEGTCEIHETTVIELYPTRHAIPSKALPPL